MGGLPDKFLSVMLSDL